MALRTSLLMPLLWSRGSWSRPKLLCAPLIVVLIATGGLPHCSDWDSSDATYSPLLSSDTSDPGSASAGSGGVADAGHMSSGGGFAGAGATGSAVAADSAGLGEQYAADRAGIAADPRGVAGTGGGGSDVAAGAARATGASADDQCALLSLNWLHWVPRNCKQRGVCAAETGLP